MAAWLPGRGRRRLWGRLAIGSGQDLPYRVRARLADNLFLQRRRAGHSQDELAELARISRGQIGSMENGQVGGRLDTWVRLAGALSITLDDLLAGVTWTSGEIEFEVEAGYEVGFDFDQPSEPGYSL